LIVTGIPETGKQYLRRINGGCKLFFPPVSGDNGGRIGSGSRGGVRHSAREITFCPVVGAMADRSGDCDGVRKIVLRPVSRPPGKSCLRGTEQVCGDSGKTAGHLLAAGKCDPIFARPNG